MVRVVSTWTDTVNMRNSSSSKQQGNLFLLATKEEQKSANIKTPSDVPHAHREYAFTVLSYFKIWNTESNVQIKEINLTKANSETYV